MKIGLVLDDTLDKPDGVQQHVLTIGTWLSKEGHKVHYLVAKTERNDIPNVHSLGRFAKVKYNQNTVRTPLPTNIRAIKKLIRTENFDVLHVMLPYSPFLAKQIIRSADDRTAVIGTFHILPASSLHGFTNKLLRIALGRSLKRIDTIFAVSEPAVHFARKAYGLPSTYLPNPINIEAFRSGKRLGNFNTRKLNIVYLGRLVQRKGIMELIAAYNALPDELAKQTRLIVCGRGPLKSKARKLVASDRNVTFKGYISEKDKPDYLATADIAVFPSTGGESFGIVLIEAMAAGSRVVVGGNNPGYSSVLGSQPYLLFDPKNQKAFVEHLALFITDHTLRDKMTSWQQSVIGQYDVSVVGPEIVKAYEQALHRRKEMR